MGWKKTSADPFRGWALRFFGSQQSRNRASGISASDAQRPRQLGARGLRSGHQKLYTFLRDVEKIDEPGWLHNRMLTEDPNAVIGMCAEDGSSSLCFETMKVFASAYGAEAGNIALKVLATGGIYLGGGIAPKILKDAGEWCFYTGISRQGRMSPLLQSIPVRIILDDTCALLGAAAHAEAEVLQISGHSERAASFSHTNPSRAGCMYS